MSHTPGRAAATFSLLGAAFGFSTISIFTTLLTKAGVLAIGYVALWTAIGAEPGLLDPWHRWDAPHYTDIAVFGYMANDPGNLSAPGYQQVFPGDLDLYIVFFPLFPWLVAAVNALVRDPILSAFVVATIAMVAMNRRS